MITRSCSMQKILSQQSKVLKVQEGLLLFLFIEELQHFVHNSHKSLREGMNYKRPLECLKYVTMIS